MLSASILLVTAGSVTTARVNETFAYTATGPVGLVKHNPRVIVAYTSGGVPMGSGYDMATPYIRQVLGFIGITNIEFVAAEGASVDEAAAIARERRTLRPDGPIR